MHWRTHSLARLGMRKVRTTSGTMRGQNEAKSPIVYSCSTFLWAAGPCSIVLRDRCRNCSDRLIPPYSVHPQTSALHAKTTRLPDLGLPDVVYQRDGDCSAAGVRDALSSER